MPVAETVSQNAQCDLMSVLRELYTQLPLKVKTEPIYQHIQDVSPKSNDLKSPEQPSSSTGSSPRGSAGRSDSPASTVGSLPKESGLCERKRPLAIQELLQSKKARLQNQKVRFIFLSRLR